MSCEIDRPRAPEGGKRQARNGNEEQKQVPVPRPSGPLHLIRPGLVSLNRAYHSMKSAWNNRKQGVVVPELVSGAREN